MATETATVTAPQVEVDAPAPAPTNTETSQPQPSSEVPSAETLRKVGDYKVLDREGKEHTFKSLVEGPDATERVLVLFVRHFFCGICQEFLQVFTETIEPDNIKKLGNTSVVVIGCGDPGLIDFYAKETKCPFTFYADPTRKLYDDLGMVRTLTLGPKAKYLKTSFLRNAARSMYAAISNVSFSMMSKGGDISQVGGDFLFEPSGDGNGKKVSWCFKMENTRNHAPMETLKEVLDPTGQILKRD